MGKQLQREKNCEQSLILCKRCYRKTFELKVKKRRASFPNHRRDSWLCVNLPYAFSYVIVKKSFKKFFETDAIYPHHFTPIQVKPFVIK